MKNWYESLTMWAAIGLIILGAANLAKGGDFKETVEYFLIALMGVGIRTAQRKIK